MDKPAYLCGTIFNKEEDGAVFMNATNIFKVLNKEEGSVLRGVTAHAFCRLLPTMGKRAHTKWGGNGYYVVVKCSISSFE